MYVERTGRRDPKFKCTGIDSLQKKELVQEICQSVIEKVGETSHFLKFSGPVGPVGCNEGVHLMSQGIQLILAYSWARPAILVAGKG